MVHPKSTIRPLRFTTPDDLLTEVRRLVDAERAGRLTRSGNWSLGQCLGHLATWIDFPYDGYPPNLRPPLMIKLMLRPFKKKFLRGPLKPGVRIPKLATGTLGDEPRSTEDGLARFERAWVRLRSAPPSIPNPIFGPMTHDEWIQGHLRHAELHLGFLRDSRHA